MALAAIGSVVTVSGLDHADTDRRTGADGSSSLSVRRVPSVRPAESVTSTSCFIESPAG
jgi:hypothetical protein